MNYITTTIPFKINKAFKDIKEKSERFIVLYGGGGSGKSHYTTQHIILNCLSQKNIRWCCIRKVANTLRNSVFQKFVDLIDEYNLYKYVKLNKTEMTIEFKNSGSKIIMLGIDDPEKIKSIAGIHHFWIEECSELTQTDFEQVNLRLRENETGQIFVTFNPVIQNHWLKKRFFDNIDNKAYVLKTTYLDNNMLPQAYKEQLEGYKDLDQYYYNVYCLGEWGSLEGLIYNNWSVIRDFPDCNDIFYGLDFGYNAPSALVRIGIKDNEFYIQQLLYQSNLTNSELINKLKELKVNGIVYCDSAEPARIQELKNNGFNAVASDKSVKDGIDFIKSQRLHVTDDSIELKNELSQYHWRTDKSGNSIDEPVKIKDHLLDAMRYGIYTHCKSHITVPRLTNKGIKYPKEHETPDETKAIINKINEMRFRRRIGI